MTEAAQTATLDSGAEASPTTRTRATRAVVTALVLFLAIQGFPGHYQNVEPSLDSGYMWGFNFVDNSSFLFGRDVVYTYGPLGYLLWPMNEGNNLRQAMLFRVGVHAIFLAAAGWLMFAARGLLYPVLFVAGYVVAGALGLTYEYHLLCVLVLLMSATMTLRTGRTPLFVLMGAYAGMLLLMKFNLGVAALFTVFLSPLAMGDGGRRLVRHAGAAAAGYAAALAGLTIAYFETPAHLFSWLRQSVWVAGDYSEAMSFYDFKWGLPACLFCMALYAGVCARLVYRKAPFRLLALALLPAVFFAYKHGNVRQVGLALVHFFTFLLAILALLALVSGLRRERVRMVAAAYAAVLLVTVALRMHPGRTALPQTFAKDLAGITGVNNARALCDLTATKDALDQASEAALQPNLLPRQWVDLMRAEDATVDAIPWDIAYIPANDLAWRPNPTFQLFEAYNRPLDAIASAHFADSARAPGYLVWDFNPRYLDVDLRYPLWNPPRTVKTILEHYQPVSVDSGVKPRLLMQRRPNPVTETLVPFKTDVTRGLLSFDDASWEERLVPLPGNDTRLYVSLELELTLWGRIRKILYRVPPVFLTVTFKNGRNRPFHIIPDLARQPMLVNPLPLSAKAVANLAFNKCADAERVTGMVVVGPGVPFYTRDIRVAWHRPKDAAPLQIE